MPLPFLILGNPENRRVSLFQDALGLEGLPPARVVSWVDFLRDPAVLDSLKDEPLHFRLDSAGESDEVEHALLNLGWPRARDFGCRTISPEALAALPRSLGRIICPRQNHLGFDAALGVLDGVLSRHPQWRPMVPTSDVRELFDKRQTSARWSSLGIPVPERLEGVRSLTELLRAMQAEGWDEVFIKMSASSSASCLGVLQVKGRALSLRTTIEVAPDGWFNTLKVRHITAPPRVNELVQFLLDEGSQIERAIPKATLDDAFFDLRVLTIAQEPRFVVVRQNNHPITNLHLGGWRGDLDKLKAVVPAASWASAMETCRRVARCYSTLHVGIDLMFEPGFAAHRVIEANAFGDLLPRLETDGRNVWQWQIRETLQRE